MNLGTRRLQKAQESQQSREILESKVRAQNRRGSTKGGGHSKREHTMCFLAEEPEERFGNHRIWTVKGRAQKEGASNLGGIHLSLWLTSVQTASSPVKENWVKHCLREMLAAGANQINIHL